MRLASFRRMEGLGLRLARRLFRKPNEYLQYARCDFLVERHGPERMRSLLIIGIFVSMSALTSCAPVGEPTSPDSSLSETEESADTRSYYVNETSLVLPTDYREWPFIGSGLGLTYEEEVASPERPPTFTNVFVNPAAYRGFMETGIWPNESIFVLEFRRSETEAVPNNGGRFQGDLSGIEAEVKDSRFPDGWAFFNFGGGPSLLDVAQPLTGEAVASCVQCHTENTAVERTFVQFYPTLLEVARREGTVKPGF